MTTNKPNQQPPQSWDGPTLIESLRAIDPKSARQDPDFLHQLGTLAARFPNQMIVPQMHGLLEELLGHWSVTTQHNGGQDWVMSSRNVDEGLDPKVIRLQDFQNGNNARRIVGYQGNSIAMLVRTAIIGDDIVVLSGIESRVRSYETNQFKDLSPYSLPDVQYGRLFNGGEHDIDDYLRHLDRLSADLDTFENLPLGV